MIVLVLVGAFVLAMLTAGAAAALVAANRLRLEVLVRQGKRTARLAQMLLEMPLLPLTTTLAGIALAQVLLAWGLSKSFLTGGPLLSAGAAWESGLLLVLVGGLAFYLGGLLLPSVVAHEQANRLVQPGAVWLRVATYLLWPLVRPARILSDRLARQLSMEADTVAIFMQQGLAWEGQQAEEDSATARDLEETESQLLANALAFETLRVRDCMVPRTDIVAVEEHTDLETLRQRFIESGYSRLPVYRKHIDQIIGIVFAHDLFRTPQSLAEMIRPMRFVPESKPASALLKEFLQTNTSIAIVIDEYGGTAGLVTREDLLEELIGDIQDEFDVDEDEEYLLRRLDDRTWLVSGRVEIEELREAGLELSEGDYDTVAGYLLERLGTIPKPMETFELDGYRFTILKASQSRIEQIRITRL